TGGVMLCAASAFIVIPTLLYLTDGRNPSRALPEPVHIHTVVAFIFHFPKTVLFGTIVLLIWLSSGLSNIWYDHNLLHMQPEGLESVDLEMKLLKKWDKGAWFALSIADSREELLKRKQEFEKDPMLKVDEIVSRFPVTSPAKQSIINAIAQQLANLPERPAGMVNPDAQKMGQVLGLLRQTLETMPVPVQAVRPTGPGDDNTTSQRQLLETIRHLDLAREQIRLLSNDEWIHRISTFQQMFAGAILNRLYLIRYTASPTPPDLSDLPESLLSRYIGQKSGRYLMRIYSTTEIWTMDHLKEFIAKVKKVDPNATGNPIQTYEASLQMQRSYRQSAIGAFLAICLLILLDFRSIGYTLLVLIPLAIGSFMALGIMGLLNIPFNPANTIVVPLVLGIGVDDGVHLVHNYRLQRGQYSMPPSLASSIVMTTLTTIIGFGSLMIASHRGLESLGRVLVIGISACTFASLIVMPAVFTLLSTKNSARSDENNT
ncbi:MAG: MMPL family transporter, partial [Thermoguttaceae bacterium]|nr:MMPL family transporter [Thermoguttaceae bacterium]